MSQAMFDEVRPAFERNGVEPSEAHLVFDPTSGSLAYVDSAATDLFGLHEPNLDTMRVTDIIPQLADTSLREFTTRVASRDGNERDLTVRLERLRVGSFGTSGAMLAVVRVGGLSPSIGSRETRLEALWSLVVRRGFAGNDQVRAILREAREGIGLDTVEVARVDGRELVVEFADRDVRAGARAPLAASVERYAIEGTGTFSILDARKDPSLGAMPDGAYLTSAFRVGEAHWALTFSALRPRETPFELEDWLYVEHVVAALARAIERRDSDARIERLAYSDALTSLPNRLALLERLDEALAESERIGARTAVLFLDVDGFKGVNDSIGHRGGDVVLAEVAHRLRGTLRREEYIGRLGGDEFAIVVPHVEDRAQIEAMADRIGAVLSYPFVVEEARFSLSASIGAAVYPENAQSRDELLACADAAMYAAKNDGGSRVRFPDPPRAAFSDARAITASDEPARDIGYLLCYQPICDVATGLVTSAEALVRRIHPLHGLLAPERGWSIASDTEGRRALDRWVLREAATQARAWRRAGFALRLDVNLAAYDRREIDALLADASLAEDVLRLRIELGTDFVAAGGETSLAPFVHACAADGFAFALDGFAGAFATLPTLASVPISAVKLEGALARGAILDRTTRAIVEGTIVVARSLGWTVIAKGVETAAEQEVLVGLGCDGIQGYHVAHPMTAADFTTWLRARQVVEAPR